MKQLVLQAQDDIKKIDALMNAFEKTYLDLDVAPSDYERKCRADYMFYAIWDAAKDAMHDIECIEAECNNSKE